MNSMLDHAQRVKKAAEELKLRKRELERTQAQLEGAQVQLSSHLEAQEFLNFVIQGIQKQVHVRIADVVNRCLESVFDDPYTFEIIFEEKRGRTEARMVLKRGELEVDPMESVGGGVVDVVSFALRVASILFSRPAVSRTLLLDEPFKHVSKEYRERCRDMMLTLSSEMGFQLILVTHDPVFEIGHCISPLTDDTIDS